MSVRAMLKRAVERALVMRPIRSLVSRAPTDGMLVLAYHNVVGHRSEEWGDASLHLAVDDFADQLDVLQREADVVRLDSTVSTRGSRPRVAITFDDAYGGAIRNALPLLADRQLPATIFVSPGMLGGQTFWWDLVRTGVGAGLPEDFRVHALTVLGGRHDAVLAEARDRGYRIVEPPEEARTAREEELVSALESQPWLSVGAHTWSHVCLPNVPVDEMRREIVRSLEWVSGFGAQGLPYLAYPYGQYDHVVQEVASASGVATAYRVEGGWHRTGATPSLALPRFNVPAGISAAGFELRLMGTLR